MRRSKSNPVCYNQLNVNYCRSLVSYIISCKPLDMSSKCPDRSPFADVFLIIGFKAAEKLSLPFNPYAKSPTIRKSSNFSAISCLPGIIWALISRGRLVDSSYRRKEIPLARRLADMINLSDKLLRMKYGRDPCINHAVLRDFNALFAIAKRIFMETLQLELILILHFENNLPRPRATSYANTPDPGKM